MTKILHVQEHRSSVIIRDLRTGKCGRFSYKGERLTGNLNLSPEDVRRLIPPEILQKKESEL